MCIEAHFINGNMFSEYLFTNIFIIKPCLMFRVDERFIWLPFF